MFKIENVTKHYKNETALANVSFEIGKGMNLIMGPSGSGKSSLLKILSGMDRDFEGSVRFRDQEIKTMSDTDLTYHYNKVFGFIWQDFNLIEEASVLENMMIPQALHNKSKENSAGKILKDLKIQELKDKKVKFLSGGQKQRVAIARELMKNPDVIFADEPCSALDHEAADAILNILRTISKSKTVILISHDPSIIQKSDTVIELEKGSVIKQINTKSQTTAKASKTKEATRLSFSNAITLIKIRFKNNIAKTLTSAMTLMIASVLLLTSTTGAVSGQSEFDTLYQTYGDTLLDINIYNAFISASGTGKEEENKPNGDVSQKIAGIYDTYAKDPRIKQISYLQPLDEITIKYNSKTMKPKSSGNMPMMNPLIAGDTPNKHDQGVVVPQSLVEEMGLSPEEAIGKEIEIDAWMFVDEVRKPIKVNTKIIGVMETKVKGEYDGNAYEFELEDAFLFAKDDLNEISKQSGKSMDKMPFSMRPLTAESMIEIKDELNAQGIVPLGQFELVSDLVRLNQQSNQQSQTASTLISVLSVLMVGAIVAISTKLRSRESAIYKVSGFNKKQSLRLNAIEWIFTALIALMVSLVMSPLINEICKKLFNISILSIPMALKGLVMLLMTSAFAVVVSSLILVRVDASKALKAGER